MSANKRLLVIDREDTVLQTGSDETIRLTVHRFRPQRRGNQIDGPPTQLSFKVLSLYKVTPFDYPHFDTSVLLWTKGFTLCTIVIHTRLAILWRVDSVTFAEFDFTETVKFVGLPSDEGVVVRIRVCRDEGPAPVYS